MTSWVLYRYRYGESVTDGVLVLGDSGQRFVTIERPWLPGARGGMPNISCIPSGVYQLDQHYRPSGDEVLILSNEDNGVYRNLGAVPDAGGRYGVLIHAANRADQVQGCIAPGLQRVIDDRGRAMVTSSRAAMRQIMAAYDMGIELRIVDEMGARECF